MKGFILSVKKAKNEDCIAIVLSNTEIRSYYRFYGARHSILQLGNLLNFEVEGEDSQFLPKLRKLSLIEFSCMKHKKKLILWQDFIKKLAFHLEDADSLEAFYYDLLLEAVQHCQKQNPKRIICESYLKLIIYEKRLSTNTHCFICEEAINKEISLMQGFKPAHPKCIHSPALSSQKVFDFFRTQSTICLEDEEVDILFDVLMKGL